MVEPEGSTVSSVEISEFLNANMNEGENK